MRDNHVAISSGADQLEVVLVCAMCHETYTYVVSFEQYMSWRAGDLVQRAFPDMPREDREMFVSETCNSCFHKLFDGMQFESPERSRAEGV